LTFKEYHHDPSKKLHSRSSRSLRLSPTISNASPERISAKACASAFRIEHCRAGRQRSGIQACLSRYDRQRLGRLLSLGLHIQPSKLETRKTGLPFARARLLHRSPGHRHDDLRRAAEFRGGQARVAELTTPTGWLEAPASSGWRVFGPRAYKSPMAQPNHLTDPRCTAALGDAAVELVVAVAENDVIGRGRPVCRGIYVRICGASRH